MAIRTGDLVRLRECEFDTGLAVDHGVGLVIGIEKSSSTYYPIVLWSGPNPVKKFNTHVLRVLEVVGSGT